MAEYVTARGVRVDVSPEVAAAMGYAPVAADPPKRGRPKKVAESEQDSGE